MQSLKKAFPFLLTYILFCVALRDAVNHQTGHTSVLGRFSYSYFAVVVVLALFLLASGILLIGYLLRLNWTTRILLTGNQRLLARPSIAWFFPLGLLSTAVVASTTVYQSEFTSLKLLGASSVLLALSVCWVVYRQLLPVVSPSVEVKPSTDTNILLGFLERLETTALINSVVTLSQRDSFIIGIIVLLGLFLFGRGLFDAEKIVYGSDLFGLFYVLEVFNRQALGTEQLPLWNPHMFGGMPALDLPATMLFYPPQMLLRWLLPLNLSITWGTALHISLAGVNMYVLCRHYKLRRWIAFVCAVAFMFNSNFSLRVVFGHTWLIYALTWFPLAWLLLIYILEEGRLWAVPVLSIVLAFVLLSGHPVFPGYTLLFLGCYWLYHAGSQIADRAGWRPIARGLLLFSLVIVLAGGLVAVQFLPAMNLSTQTFLSEGYDLTYAGYGAIEPHNLVTMLIPNAFAEARVNGSDRYPYIGLLALWVAPLSLFDRKNTRLIRYLWALIVVCLLISFGNDLKLFSFLFTVFSPYRLLRIPSRVLVVASPSLILLAGFGLQTIADQRHQTHWFNWLRDLYKALTFCAIGGTIGYLAVILLYPQYSFGLPNPVIGSLGFGVITLVIGYSVAVPLFEDLPGLSGWGMKLAWICAGAIWALTAFPVETTPYDQVSEILGSFAHFIFFSFGLLYCLSTFHSRRLKSVVALLCLLVTADLVSYTLPSVRFENPPGVPAELVDLFDDYVDGRIFLSGSKVSGNYLSLEGFNNIDGYNSGILSHYAKYVRAAGTKPHPDTIALLHHGSVEPKALDFLSVSLAIYSSAEDTDPSLHLLSDEGNQYIYLNQDAMARVNWVSDVQLITNQDEGLSILMQDDFDYHETVLLYDEVDIQDSDSGSYASEINIEEIDTFDGSVVVSTSTDAPGILVFNEPYYNERHAWIDGVMVPVLIANTAFMAVELPAGEHLVELRFIPRFYRLGRNITLVTLAICLGWLAILIYNMKRVTSNPK